MERTEPTLAVVISAYNYARFLPDALESVLSQEPAFDEVIVVNDGSTDATADVLAGYEDRVTIVHSENRGQTAACLEGARIATSDYVYLLDADDYLADGMVAAVRPLLATRPVKVQFQLEGVDTDCQPLQSVFPTYPQHYCSARMREDNRELGFYQCPPTSGNVVDRERLLSCNLDPQANPRHIDATGILVQPYLGEVATLPQRLAFYRVHEGNLYNTCWSDPCVGQLEKELKEFDDSWSEAVRVLNLGARPFGKTEPLFVLERKLMIGALENRSWLLPEATRFIRRLLSTHLPRYSKLLLTGWALALVCPSANLRQRLIRQRRNPAQRSRFVRSFVQRRVHEHTAVDTKPARPTDSSHRQVVAH